MMNPYDTGLLSEFEQNLRAQIKRLRETGRPTVLTADGHAELVVMSAAAYRKMLETIDRAEAIIGIQQGLDDIRRGDVLPLDEAFDEIRRGGGRHPGA